MSPIRRWASASQPCSCGASSPIEAARESDTRLLVFAETGAFFGPEYCRTVGIDTVVSEPFPFYIFQGVSRIEVHRRE